MTPLERLDEESRRVVALAEEEARLLGHPDVGDDHLLLGVTRARPELVGVPIEALRARVVAGRGGQARAAGADPRHGPGFAEALRIAGEEAEAGTIGTLDLLAAVAAARGLGAEALARIGVDSMADATGFIE